MARLARTSATAPKVCRLSRLGCNPIRRPLNSNPWLKCLWIGLRLVFDFQGALLGLMSGFVRGALAGLLHMMPSAFRSLLRRLSRMLGCLFSVVSGIFHVLFCAFLWERKTCRCHCEQQNHTREIFGHTPSSSWGI